MISLCMIHFGCTSKVVFKMQIPLKLWSPMYFFVYYRIFYVHEMDEPALQHDLNIFPNS